MAFHSNTAMICYNCRRVAVVRLALYWLTNHPVMLTWMDGNPMMLTSTNEGTVSPVFPVGQPEPGDVLEVFFVSCAVCLTLAGVHNPITALFNKYLDSRPYANIIRRLVYIFGCPARIPEHWKFSITSFAVKSLTRIRDVSKIFNMPIIPDKNVMILQDSEEITTDYRFFAHKPYIMNRRISRYEHTSDIEKGDMPFASVLNRPPVFGSTRQAAVREAPVCHRCLLDLSGVAPPEYTLDSPDMKATTLELAGKYNMR